MPKRRMRSYEWYIRNNNEISQQSATSTPCGKAGSCECCPIKHIVDAGLHTLRHAEKKIATARLGNELAGVQSELQRISLTATAKLHSISGYEQNALNCPRTRESDQVVSNVQSVFTAARRSIGASINDACFING